MILTLSAALKDLLFHASSVMKRLSALKEMLNATTAECSLDTLG
jgi:hypothetical protein